MCCVCVCVWRNVFCEKKRRKNEEKTHKPPKRRKAKDEMRRMMFPPPLVLTLPSLLARVAAVGAELHAGARAAALGAELGAGRGRRGRGRSLRRSLGSGGRGLGRLGLDLLLGQRALVDLDLAGVRVARTVRRQGAAATAKAKALLAKELVVARVAVHNTLALRELGDFKLLAAVLAVFSFK